MRIRPFTPCPPRGAVPVNQASCGRLFHSQQRGSPSVMAATVPTMLTTVIPAARRVVNGRFCRGVARPLTLKQPVAFSVESCVSAALALPPLAPPCRAVPPQAAKPLALRPGRPPAQGASSHPIPLLRPRAPHRPSLFQPRQPALRLRHPFLVFPRGHRRTHPDKYAIAARPTALRHLVVVMDSIPLDLFDLPDKQTIAMQVPSADNQVPRLDSLCAVHFHDPTRVPAPYQLQ